MACNRSPYARAAEFHPCHGADVPAGSWLVQQARGVNAVVAGLVWAAASFFDGPPRAWMLVASAALIVVVVPSLDKRPARTRHAYLRGSPAGGLAAPGVRCRSHSQLSRGRGAAGGRTRLSCVASARSRSAARVAAGSRGPRSVRCCAGPPRNACCHLGPHCPHRRCRT